MISVVSNSNGLGALYALQKSQNSLDNVMKRLATGRLINAGKDDPAGLIVSERLSSELRKLGAENRSLARADANANIADGYASQLSSLYGELDTLVLASANEAGLSSEEVAANQMQIDNTVASIERLSSDASSALGGFNLPNDGNVTVTAEFDSALTAARAVRSGGANDLASGNFQAAQDSLSTATTTIATARGRIGGFQKDVVAPSIRANQIATENLTASRSRIADTDYAVEISNLNRDQVLTTAGFKVLGIAIQQSKSVLDLFK